MQETNARPNQDKSSKNKSALRWIAITAAAAFVLIPIAAFASIRGLSVQAPVQLGSAVQVAQASQGAAASWQDDDRRPGFLGVSTTGISNSLRSHFGAPEGVGVLVSEITQGAAAEIAGLQAGDVIVRVDGEDIESSGDLRRAIRRAGADNSARIELVRDGSYQTYDVVLDEARSQRVVWRGRSGNDFDYEDWSDEEREEFERRMEEFGERMGEWGEEFGETFGARMEAFGERMEAFGEAFGEDWAEEFERNAEEWGAKMEAWGEEFGRAMEEKYGDDWDGHHTFHFNGDWDDEEFQEHMEELHERLQEMDWSSIGDAVESALEAVDWSGIDVDLNIDEAIEAALDAVDGAKIQVDGNDFRNLRE